MHPPLLLRRSQKFGYFTKCFKSSISRRFCTTFKMEPLMNSDKCENLLGWGIGAFWLTACIAVGVGIEIDDHQERMHNKRAATEIKREVPPSSSTGGEIKGGEPTVYECISKSD